MGDQERKSSLIVAEFSGLSGKRGRAKVAIMLVYF
jgi:hypothetical protein